VLCVGKGWIVREEMKEMARRNVLMISDFRRAWRSEGDQIGSRRVRMCMECRRASAGVSARVRH
jgi:hypothetical protein